MMENKRVIILYNKVEDHANLDEKDVLAQVNFVAENLLKLGYNPINVPITFDLSEAVKIIKSINPHFIFNLVEAFNSKGEFVYFAPALLNYLRIPYTGANLIPMFITTNKLLTKKELKRHNINTAPWFEIKDIDKIKPEERYIIKPIAEDGSVEIDDHSVFWGNDFAYIERIKQMSPNYYYIEKFIDGREINLGLLGGTNDSIPEVLPAAEFTFDNFGPDKPRILGYRAKWIEDSYEYENSLRDFEIPEEDAPLIHKLGQIATQCWKVFHLSGYARVDFRIDHNNNPFVLEINTNPCINPDSGFVAASERAGLKFTDVITRMIKDAFKNDSLYEEYGQ
jgi:D-alanine-D-alanine ligase